MTIPGDTTAGKWDDSSTSQGMYINFNLGSGSNYLGSANAWSNSNLLGVTGDTRWVDTLGATFDLTAVQLVKGTTVPTYLPRAYAEEFRLCQRYCQAYGGTSGDEVIGIGQHYGAGSNIFIQFDVPMRGTVSVSSPDWTIWAVTNAAGAREVLTTFNAISGVGPKGCYLDVSGGGIAGHATEFMTLNTSARIVFSSEL
jgi:hypothetical protein